MSENIYGILNTVISKIEDENKRIEQNSPNIMIIGKTGVGKSTLINSVFRENISETGIGAPITQVLRKINKKGVPVNIYDTPGLELSSDTQKKLKEELLTEIRSRAKSGVEKDYIHVIWYCINSESHRFEDTEKELINDFSKEIPVFVVLTKAYSKPEANEFRKKIESFNLPIKGVKVLLAQDKIISDDIIIKSYGLDFLVSSTLDILPELMGNAFINAQKISLDFKSNIAQKWLLGYVATTFATGFSPIPFSDAPILIGIQTTMISHLTVLFGITLEKSIITAILSTVLGTSATSYTGTLMAANLLKLVPGVGTIVGGLITGGIASTLTTALGIAYIELMKYIFKLEVEGKKISVDEVTSFLKNELGIKN